MSDAQLKTLRPATILRIARIRRDKPVEEADRLDTVLALVENRIA